MAIALPMMRRPGAAIAMASSIAMVLWVGLEMTTIAMTTLTTMCPKLEASKDYLN